VWQEGLLRHVPIVGGIYNWINPLQKPTITGRCLSLKEGKLETTESIYKLQTEKNDLAPLQEHSYEKHNNKIEKEETLEESKNAINNQLHQPATESSEIELDAAEADENTFDQPSPKETKAISRSNSESETSPALVQPVETESIV
jgi:hypothetical protein